MKVRNSKGELKELVIKANDSIPANGIIDFDGDVVPEGYEQVEDKTEIKITELEKKINNNTYLSRLLKITDGETKSIEVNSGKVYLYINSHIYKRCVILITVYNNIVNTDVVYKSDDNALPTITLEDNKIIIKALSQCRGILFRLNDLVCA